MMRGKDTAFQSAGQRKTGIGMPVARHPPKKARKASITAATTSPTCTFNGTTGFGADMRRPVKYSGDSTAVQIPEADSLQQAKLPADIPFKPAMRRIFNRHRVDERLCGTVERRLWFTLGKAAIQKRTCRRQPGKTQRIIKE